MGKYHLIFRKLILILFVFALIINENRLSNEKLYFSAILIDLSHKNNYVFNDDITLFEDKLNELKNDLQGNSFVGYIYPIKAEDDDVKIYYLTQYTLAPIIVAKDIKYDNIIAHFGKSNINYLGILNNNAYQRKEYGNGLILYKRRF